MDTPSAARVLVAAAARDLAGTLPDLSDRVTRDLLARIPELRVEPALDTMLELSVRSNVEAVLQSMTTLDESAAPSAPGPALAYARTLAQRGVPVHALVRAYRIGHQYFTDALLGAVRSREPNAQLEAAEVSSMLSFRYIDHVTQAVVEGYESEREKWLSSRNTIWIAELHATLADPARPAPASIGSYRLSNWHQAGIVWTPPSRPDLASLRGAAETVARALSPSNSVMVIPQDENTVWFWSNAPTRPRLADPAALRQSLPPHARLALGAFAADAAGFRSSHAEAVSAKAISDLRPDRFRPVTSIEERGLRVVARFVETPDAAAHLVGAVLGRLALDNQHAERLRETLRLYLRHNHSNQAAAAELGIHPNSVKYRIAQAQNELSASIESNRLDIEVALLICDLFGSRVLSPA